MNLIKVILIFVVVSSFLVADVAGLKVSVLEGNNGASSGLAANYGGSINDVIGQDIKLSPQEGKITNHL